MSDRRISQREAQQMRKRLRELEAEIDQQRRGWAAEWPDGVCIGRLTVEHPSQVDEAVRVARKLRHAVVVMDQKDDLVFFALPLPQAPK